LPKDQEEEHIKKGSVVSQVSKRLRETDLIRKAYNALQRTLDTNKSVTVEADDNVMDNMDIENEDNTVEDNEIQSKLIGKPLFCVNLDKPFNQGMVECLAEKSVRTRRELHPIIISFLFQEQDFDDYPLYGERMINIYTEYKRDGTCYRAHPNYNSFGEWYDWAMVKFEPAGGSKNFPINEKGGYYARNLYPCKVLCFLQAKDKSIYAVVQCCNDSDHKEDGILIERWKKEYEVDEVMNQLVPKLRCVPVDAFETSCFVVEDKPGLFEEMGTDVTKMNNGVTLVKPRETAWPKQFFRC